MLSDITKKHAEKDSLADVDYVNEMELLLFKDVSDLLDLNLNLTFMPGHEISGIEINNKKRSIECNILYAIPNLANHNHVGIEDLYERYAVQAKWNLLVKPGDTVIDIGAYIGDTAVVLSMLTTSDGAVIAFEPNPHVYRFLKFNSFSNPKLNIFPINAAISDTDYSVLQYSDHGNENINGGVDLTLLPGTSPWTKSLFASIPNRNIYNVIGMTLEYSIDKLLNLSQDINNNISFVKIDCEGYEPYILFGNSNFFKRYNPFIFLEWFKFNGAEDNKNLFDAISKIDYVALNPLDCTVVTSAGTHISDILCVPSSKLSYVRSVYGLD